MTATARISNRIGSHWFCPGEICLSLACLVVPFGAAHAAFAADRKPVLVELFTSEGCSDCPAADALLARLDSTQFVPGAIAIVLSEHVTYWNDLGWKDPFSSADLTQRQAQYESRLGLSYVYTPQAVIDGIHQAIGGNVSDLSREIAQAATEPKSALTIENPHWEGDAVRFSIRADAVPHATLMAALAEDATQSAVARGENAGRTLHHVAVVCTLQDLGMHATDGRPLTLKLSTPQEKLTSRTPYRIVVFLEDTRSGRVLALAQQSVTR